MSEPTKASSGTRNPRDHSHHSVDGRPLSHHSAASDDHTATSLDDHHARSHHSDTGGANGHTHSDLPFDGHIHTYIPDMDEDRIYMDYNATTPLEPQVIQVVTEALHEAWGNPSSTYTPDVTSVAVSKVTGRVEVEDVLAAVRSSTCLISIMMANNETGVLMPIRELCQRIRFVNRQRQHRILLHTDAAQAIGKVRVDARDLGVDYLTVVGHKFYAPRMGALYVNGPGTTTPLYPMLFGGGQERNFRPGTENTPMIAGLGKAAELVNSNLTEYETHMLDTRDYLEKQLEAVFGRERIHFNSHFPDSETLPNTCNMSILGPGLQGRKVLASCRRLLASVGAACHSNRGDRPSHILLSCGIPEEVAANALRLSVGRGTSRDEVDLVVEDLKNAVERLEELN